MLKMSSSYESIFILMGEVRTVDSYTIIMIDVRITDKNGSNNPRSTSLITESKRKREKYIKESKLSL